MITLFKLPVLTMIWKVCEINVFVWEKIKKGLNCVRVWVEKPLQVMKIIMSFSNQKPRRVGGVFLCQKYLLFNAVEFGNDSPCFFGGIYNVAHFGIGFVNYAIGSQGIKINHFAPELFAH